MACSRSDSQGIVDQDCLGLVSGAQLADSLLEEFAETRPLDLRQDQRRMLALRQCDDDLVSQVLAIGVYPIDHLPEFLSLA